MPRIFLVRLKKNHKQYSVRINRKSRLKNLAINLGAVIGAIIILMIGIIAYTINLAPSELMNPATPEENVR